MLEIKNLTICFGEGAPAVAEDICLTVNSGDRICIIGETGSGKSVLLQATLRLLPSNAIIHGEVLLDGKNLLTQPIEKLYAVRGHEIGYIPQSSGGSLNPLMTIGQQLNEAMHLNLSLSKKERKKRIIQMLRQYHLGDEERLYSRYPHQLSGGMRQRVLVIMGLCTNAPYVFADEPTKGIDFSRVQLIEESFRNLGNRALLCVTHDLQFAQNISQQITVLYAAQQVESGPTKEVLSVPLHPYTKALLMALPQNGAVATMGFAPPHQEFAYSGCRFYNRCSQRCEKCLTIPPMICVGERKVRCWLYAD